MTSEGTGSASASTRSTSWPARFSMASHSSSVRRWISGRIASTRLTMNSRVTMRRSRVCSGGSMRMKPRCSVVAPPVMPLSG